MTEDAHTYLMRQVMAQGTLIDLLFDLLVRHRTDLAQEAVQDLADLVRRSQPPMATLLARSLADWRDMLEVQQTLARVLPRPDEQP